MKIINEYENVLNETLGKIEEITDIDDFVFDTEE